MIKTVIIDDEPNGIIILQNYLKEYCPEVEVIGTGDSVLSGQEIIRELEPELVFLDIRMNDGTGFDLLDQFPGRKFHVIFSTAYDEYAIDAFKYSALDYILKPLEPEEVIRAVNRIKFYLEIFASSSSTSPEKDFIKLRTNNGYKIARFEEIEFLQSDSNYTRFHLSNGEKYVVSRTLKEFELKLPSNFFRTHQSYIVNIYYVDRLMNENKELLTKSGNKIKISRRKRDVFLKYIND